MMIQGSTQFRHRCGRHLLHRYLGHRLGQLRCLLGAQFDPKKHLARHLRHLLGLLGLRLLLPRRHQSPQHLRLHLRYLPGYLQLLPKHLPKPPQVPLRLLRWYCQYQLRVRYL